MTVDGWIAEREPPPPPRLRERLVELLHTHVRGEVTPEALVRASGEVLAQLVRDGETARASALELLAADALATYAFESQSDDPDALEARCAWAMRHLSVVADRA